MEIFVLKIILLPHIIINTVALQNEQNTIIIGR